MTLTLAILGRPNVGKSTLFNRLTGKRLALVDDTPGVTRDRREGQGRIADLTFRLIDTAGLEEATGDKLEARMRRQTETALENADVVLFLIDARAGVTPLDAHFGDFLRACGVPVILIANKCEGALTMPGLYEAHGLGLGTPVPLSAEHGEGLDGLYDALLPYAEQHATEPDSVPMDLDLDADGQLIAPMDEKCALQMAVVGRPNVGKSTLINRLLGEERMLTGPEAGITRDAIASSWRYQGQEFRLVDTAGLRRRSKVNQKIERLSASDSMRAIRFAQIVVVLIDANQPLEKQDLSIARKVIDEGRALLIGVNKWDIVDDRKAAFENLSDRLERSLPQVKGIEVIPFSARTGRGLDKLMPAVLRTYEAWNRRIATAPLNRWLGQMVEQHPPPLVQGRRVKLRYMTQAKTRPPTFVVFASLPERLPEAYSRYLVNGLRQDFDMPGTPLRLILRKGDNPYATG